MPGSGGWPSVDGLRDREPHAQLDGVLARPLSLRWDLGAVQRDLPGGGIVVVVDAGTGGRGGRRRGTVAPVGWSSWSSTVWWAGAQRRRRGRWVPPAVCASAPASGGAPGASLLVRSWPAEWIPGADRRPTLPSARSRRRIAECGVTAALAQAGALARPAVSRRPRRVANASTRTAGRARPARW